MGMLLSLTSVSPGSFSLGKLVCQGHFCFQKQGGPSRGVSIGGDTLTGL